MAGLPALAGRAGAERLALMGAFHPRPADGVPGEGTLVLLGPAEPGFWTHVTRTPEFRDGTPDALDRWSRRVLSQLAEEVGGQALFPFGEPVWPFFTWALRTGRAWQSPVRMLVHDEAGLMVSYRGAILLPGRLDVGGGGPCPCDSCPDQPCLTACPPRALTGEGYDVAACHAFLDTGAGRDNLLKGCAVRRACPVSKKYGRSEEQSAFHMRHFHPWH